MNIQELDAYNLDDAVKFNDRLNPRLWDDKEHLRPDVREQLLKIAEDFKESLGLSDLDVKDITISGTSNLLSDLNVILLNVMSIPLPLDKTIVIF